MLFFYRIDVDGKGWGLLPTGLTAKITIWLIQALINKKGAEFLHLSACRKSQNNKFLHAVRLREMELNFVFLRVGAVRWYRPRAKNGKRQNSLGFNAQGCFQSLRQHGVLLPPFNKGGLIWLYWFYFGVVQSTLSTVWKVQNFCTFFVILIP